MLKAGAVTALGTMSGTSLDGVDAAILVTDGERIFDFGPSDYRPYEASEQALIRDHLGRWQTDDVSQAARIVEEAHIALMAPFQKVDIAGFHGQTLAHDPASTRTHQCGDGARVAAALGLPVAWDFRSADMRRGGQGAPLAPFYHFALAEWMGADAPLAFLNLGGVGNITWVDPTKSVPEQPGGLLAFDTGPANAPINDLMLARRGVDFDTDGALAAAGQVDAAIIDRFLDGAYFDQLPPKSLDRDAFVGLRAAVDPLTDADAAATLTHAVVASVVRGLEMCPVMPERLLVTGGGRKNATIMAALIDAFTGDVAPVEAAGLDGDMLEAQAFAYLAVRVAKGLPLSAAGTTGVSHPCSGGRISAP